MKNNFDEAEYHDIKKLEKICIEHDKISFKLELDYKLRNVKQSNIGIISINEFMYYNSNELIGYIGISEFEQGVLEISGLVHPEYRNRGIFTQLHNLVEAELKKRNNHKILVLCDNNSSLGINFIKKVSKEYHHSEYDMILNKDLFPKSLEHSLNIRNASKNDAGEIAIMTKDFFDIEIKEDMIITESIENGSLFIAELNNIGIGSVRIELIDGVGGIYGLGVLSQYRGKGYGKELLMWSVERLIKMGTEKVILQVDTDNDNALNLYKSCGFEVDHAISYYIIKR